MSPWAVTSNCRHGPSRAAAAMGRHEQLPPWAVTSNCRNGPSRATAAMGRQEQLPPWAVTSNCRHGPPRAIPLRTCSGLRRAEEKGQPGLRRAFECFDRRPDISLYHGELLRAIKELEDDVLSCRSGEAAATARVSPPRRTGVSRELRT